MNVDQWMKYCKVVEEHRELLDRVPWGDNTIELYEEFNQLIKGKPYYENN